MHHTRILYRVMMESGSNVILLNSSNRSSSNHYIQTLMLYTQKQSSDQTAKVSKERIDEQKHYCISWKEICNLWGSCYMMYQVLWHSTALTRHHFLPHHQQSSFYPAHINSFFQRECRTWVLLGIQVSRTWCWLLCSPAGRKECKGIWLPCLELRGSNQRHLCWDPW